jgi:glutamine amidotransferase
MCRILGIQSDDPIDLRPWIDAFALRCKESKEYQGHGWGVSWREDGRWCQYRSLKPLWEDAADVPPTQLAIVHARSAFRNEGIVVENNMPFLEDELVFAFNGELHGVRLSVSGTTGAARLFELFRRFNRAAGDDVPAALERLDALITKRTEYVRALNVVVSDGRSLFVNTRYSEDPEYFTLHVGRASGVPGVPGLRLVSSEVVSTETVTPEWAPLPNGTTAEVDREMTCFS